ncbi:ATP-binding protein [Kitasatospora cheerisanensis]|uniref:Histidine kinase/HSP90-like ATPase domain-containing protein n=1 Tax=Kitasatospora cheerisanensis KCTC 2395 TaxID=1348663 RepID=A0A066YTI9_9ACTN|nr:ATP-binding protein [Kitasatospora cheerisanensis]KDN81215.1 hypothetical protein KCH_70260 [Kitasatospora cheerisanensis KCTC 2395]
MPPTDTDPTGRAAAGPAVRTAAEARAAVTAALGRHAAEHVRLHGDACLAVTELVTNAIRHAGGVTGFAVRAGAGGSVLTIDVEDADDRRPSGDGASLTDPTRIGGRGWALVQLVAASWEIHGLAGGGKRIRITLAA